MSIKKRLSELGLTLPSPPKPVATYVPVSQVGDLLFISGVVPSRDGKLLFRGKLGRELSVKDGYEATKCTVLNALAIVQNTVATLDRVKQIVKLTGYVASAEGFSEQPAVVNGASDFLVELLGDAGRHARVAVGVAELPLGVPVELELIVQVHPLA